MKRKLVVVGLSLALVVISVVSQPALRRPSLLLAYPDLVVQQVTFRQAGGNWDNAYQEFSIVIKNIGSIGTSQEVSLAVLVTPYIDPAGVLPGYSSDLETWYPLILEGKPLVAPIAAGGSVTVISSNEVVPSSPRWMIGRGYVVIVVDWPSDEHPIGQVAEGLGLNSTGETNNGFVFLLEPSPGLVQTFVNPAIDP